MDIISFMFMRRGRDEEREGKHREVMRNDEERRSEDG